MDALHDLSLSLAGISQHQSVLSTTPTSQSSFPSSLTSSSATEELFGEVRRHGGTGSQHQRHLFAILEALTQVLNEKQQAPSPTAYFAVLMTALSTQTSTAQPQKKKRSNRKGQAEDDDDSQNVASALLHLLHLVLPEVPAPVLQAKFSEINAVFQNLWATHFAQASVIRPLAQCLAIVLGSLDNAHWKQAASMDLFQKLLSLSLDQRPKVRQVAQQAMQNLVNNPARPLPSQPLSTTQQFCINFIRQCNPNDDIRPTLYGLRLLEFILPHLPSSSTGVITDALLVLPTYHQPMLTLHTLQSLQALFESANSNIMAKDLSQAIDRLAQLQPNHTDTKETLQYVAVIKAALHKLNSLDKHLAANRFGVLNKLLVNFLSSDNKEINKTTANRIKELVDVIVGPEIVAEARTAIESRVAQRPPTSLETIVSTLETGLQPAFSASHHLIFDIMALLFKKLSRCAAMGKLISNVLNAIDQLQDLVANEPQNRKLQEGIDSALGAAVTSLGPRMFLSMLPLNLSEKSSGKERAWLLPVLKESIRFGELAYFFDEILPLSDEMLQRAAKAVSLNKQREGMDMQVVAAQLWGLFPAFCVLPTDIHITFNKVAKFLGTILSEEQAQQIQNKRDLVCAGLEALVSHLTAYKKMLSEAETTASELYQGCPLKIEDINAAIQTISTYSKNFLPCLFNMFGSSISTELRNSSVATIDAFLEITSPELVNTFFKNVISKLLEATNAVTATAQKDQSSTAHAQAQLSRLLLIDLVVIFVRKLDQTNVDFLWKVIVAQLEGSKDPKQEKKCYKVLQAVCVHHGAWILANLTPLQQTLSADLTKSSHSAKKCRLRCLKQVVESVGAQQSASDRMRVGELVRAVAGEVMLCTKETNSKTRALAFDLLITMANTMAAPDILGEQDYSALLKILVAGLAGTTTHMIAAAVTSITHLFFHFKAELVKEQYSSFVEQLVLGTVLLLGMNAREVVKACLGFVKVAISSLPAPVVQPHLPSIVSGMTTWLSTTDVKNHKFRSKIKILLERLVRKYGYETIEPLVVPQHKPLLHSVKKALNEKKKAKATKDQEREASSNAKAKAKGKGKGHASFLVDGDEDAEPLDFMDPTHIQHVLSKKPRSKPMDIESKKEEDDFEIDQEGRMVFDEDEFEDADSVKGKGNKKWSQNKGGSAGGGKANRKRSLGDAFEDRNNNDESKQQQQQQPAHHHQQKATAGGKGAANKRRRTETQGGHSGERFKSKNAGGDVKKGKLDPYAYVPLDPKNLNKRVKHQTLQGWGNVVRAAQAGSKEGRKQRKAAAKQRNKN